MGHSSSHHPWEAERTNRTPGGGARAEAVPTAHLPCSVTFVNIVHQLIGQQLERRPALGTGQHHQAAKTGQKLPHFGSWILDSPRKDKASRPLKVKCITYTRVPSQAAWFWGQKPPRKIHVLFPALPFASFHSSASCSSVKPGRGGREPPPKDLQCAWAPRPHLSKVPT